METKLEWYNQTYFDNHVMWNYKVLEEFKIFWVNFKLSHYISWYSDWQKYYCITSECRKYIWDSRLSDLELELLQSKEIIDIKNNINKIRLLYIKLLIFHVKFKIISKFNFIKRNIYFNFLEPVIKLYDNLIKFKEHIKIFFEQEIKQTKEERLKTEFWFTAYERYKLLLDTFYKDLNFWKDLKYKFNFSEHEMKDIFIKKIKNIKIHKEFWLKEKDYKQIIIENKKKLLSEKEYNIQKYLIYNNYE